MGQADYEKRQMYWRAFFFRRGWSVFSFYSFLDLSCIRLSFSPSLFILTAVHKKMIFRNFFMRQASVLSEDNFMLFHRRGETNSAVFFYRALFQLCLGCLIKCSFPLVMECVSAFCRPIPLCLLQSTHMVCLSVYDFSYTGVVRFLNHLSTRGRTVHI